MPYLIQVGDELPGYALVSRFEDGVLSTSEVLVLSKFRRGGVGTRAAQALFTCHRGTWQVTQVAGTSRRLSSGVERSRCDAV